jgi:hypothetical protein
MNRESRRGEIILSSLQDLFPTTIVLCYIPDIPSGFPLPNIRPNRTRLQLKTGKLTVVLNPE